ncbi:cytochrome c oxidase assembly protein [Staphylococcus gallinarum]|uniref:cytochrome c oxidase assembly protein n=2 Tax=Staphylococcus TaxID=1279 RepID=UPI001E51D5D2|nr:cytochrome c oxidase assembly protein [Staphylococcus gallinarum]MCD8787440.1 cytochrome c oxidase assembly protein [Staphylococcus gallinarum]MCD8845247.1 cytochrome c oxidase assembly protein [Staphylococcus gallinarum]
MNSHLFSENICFKIILTLFLIMLFVIYIFFALLTNKKYKKWFLYRYVCWSIGLLSIGISLVGPLATLAHHNFIGHMITHLLIGMLAPLLIALSMPVTLLLRSIDVYNARKLTRILKSRLIQFISNPIIASLLNIGGLWCLYTTNLYMFMHHSLFIYILIHFHLFIAGYLFTISIIYVDITIHKYSYVYRSIILVLALTGHNILSKYIYANPPISVDKDEAKIAGMIMYYGGDMVDFIIILILCYQWYKKSTPRFVIDPKKN